MKWTATAGASSDSARKLRHRHTECQNRFEPYASTDLPGLFRRPGGARDENAGFYGRYRIQRFSCERPSGYRDVPYLYPE
eukprot:7181646-Pyramimonas_sp.AAC.1